MIYIKSYHTYIYIYMASNIHLSSLVIFKNIIQVPLLDERTLIKIKNNSNNIYIYIYIYIFSPEYR